MELKPAVVCVCATQATPPDQLVGTELPLKMIEADEVRRTSIRQ